MKYFAYGSNMLEQWLRSPGRVPAAQFTGSGFVRGRQLRFHKRSRDGSSKCDIPESGNDSDVVYGVLYEIPAHAIGALDRAEGVGSGYTRSKLTVSVERQDPVLATAYLADPNHIVPELQPYQWYRDLVSAGAEQHELPSYYICAILLIPVRQDPESNTRETAVAAAKALSCYHTARTQAPNDAPQ